MRPATPTFVLALACTCSLARAGDDLTQRFECAPGISVTLWAESPELYNPTAIDVDAAGRVWVTEGVNYRKWGGRNPGREHEAGDRVVILEDADGDGAAERSTVFVQSAELVSPLGICVLDEPGWPRRVFVSCSPHVLEYVDRDRDDRPDDVRRFLTGFGGHDHDHGVHSIVAGPDGALWLAVGNAGPHLVTDADGWSLRSGSLYSGGGPRAADNAPGLVSDDGRVWVGGLVLRLDRDGGSLRPIADNFRNPYEVALDSFGDTFLRDNDDDGNRACRTSWILDGGDYGFFSRDGSRSWQADRRPGQEVVRAHWHTDDPGVAPPGAIDGSGGPTGVCVYEGQLLEPWIGGAVLGADAGRGVVFAHRPRPDGAGVALEGAVFLAARGGSDDPKERWFRPSDVAVGVDGALYVADWFDPGVGGHGMGDREAYGRILRVGCATAGQREPGTGDEALDALFSPAVNVRYSGFAALRARGEAALPALHAQFEQRESLHERARLLWVLAGLGTPGRQVVEAALEDPASELRLTAWRALLASGADPLAYAAALVSDSSPAVRRAVAVSLRDVPFEACGALLFDLARDFDGTDRAYLEALGIGAEGKESELYATLLAELGPDPARWEVLLDALAWRLHPVEAVPDLLARALDPRLSPEQRERAVDALAFVPERAGAEAMLDLALAGDADVRARASFWMQQRGADEWRAYGLSSQLGLGGLEDAELVFESDVMRKGSAEVDVDVRGARALWLVVDDGGDGNSHDWADWIAPQLVGPAGELALTELPFTRASAEWGEVRIDANAGGGRMAVAGRPVATGIGAHARSEIHVALPEGYEHFMCGVGPDDGGTTQAGARTSLRFRVYVERAPDDEATVALHAELLDASLTVGARRERAGELALDPEGGMALVQLAALDRLPSELTEVVAERIFQNPDPQVRSLASAHFRRPADSGEPMPPVAELVQLEGDARRGMELFFGDVALCSTCHRVRERGGDVGPDLSAIGAKLGPEALYDALLNPSAAIAFGYDTYVVRTTDGRLYSGFLLARGERIVLKDSSGKRQVIDAEDVDEWTRLEVSTMPEDVALRRTPQELADLAAFLLEDRDAPPTLGDPVELFDGESLDGWVPFLSGRSADPADVWSVEAGELVCRGKPAGYVRTAAEYESFVLELEWRFDPAKGPGNSGVLLRTSGEDKVWPRSIEAQLQHRNAGDIWNIGEYPMQVAETRTQGRHTKKLSASSELPIGEWNRYRITLDGGELTLEVNGVVQNRAAWCELRPGWIALQSEGAEIRFRSVKLWPILD